MRPIRQRLYPQSYNAVHTLQPTHHYAFLPCFAAAAIAASFLSFFPPRKSSKCPARPAKDFSVMAVNPEVCFLFARCCFCSATFFGLMTRLPVCLRWVL